MLPVTELGERRPADSQALGGLADCFARRIICLPVTDRGALRCVHRGCESSVALT